jgi:parallel beta-helix repeat protein
VGIRIQDASNVTLQGNTVYNNGRRDIELVDATDGHGYNPSSMSAVSVCMDHEVATPGMAQQAAVQHAPTASGGQDATGPSHTAKISRTVNMKPVKGSPAPAAVASAPDRRQGRRPPASHREADSRSLTRAAERAQWTSRSAKVVFGSDCVPKAGSVRVIKKGRLADGHTAANLLCTQPDWKTKGYLREVFPAMKIDRRTHFQSTVAMLKGAGPSDALSFDVLVREGWHDEVVKEPSVHGSRRVALDVVLSRWRGKRVRLILRVRRLKGTRSLPAVWVNPILVEVP